MSQRERDFVAHQIILIAQARHDFGFAPFYPAECGADGAIENLSLPFLSDAAALALHHLIDAIAKSEKWPAPASD